MEQIKNRRKAFLLLQDGTVFPGKAFGADGEALGEVVFATGMTGYQETLTDPSFCGQIVTQTFPLVGNYGVNGEDNESDRSYVRGYIVREWCEAPSNFRCEGTLDGYLKEQKVVGLYDIDTRALTRKLREHGVMNGMIARGEAPEGKEKEELLERIKNTQVIRPVDMVSVKAPQEFLGESGGCRVALLDFGYKQSIRRQLIKRGCSVTVLPARTRAEEISSGGYDGVMLSNGPGDPAANPEIIENLKEIARLPLPIFGICLGHQLMAVAQGASSRKLKYGHRGENQPVVDLASGRTFVTSQNHGYEILGDTLPPEAGRVSHINANDGSCEGIEYASGRIFTVQFHPEACGGPQDTEFLFDRFVGQMKQGKGGR